MVNLALVHEKRMILGYKDRRGGMWIPLGGKRLLDESDQDCLMREILEETTATKDHVAMLITDARFIGEFVGVTNNTSSRVLARVYAGVITDTLVPNAEIQELRPFPFGVLMEESLVSDTTRKIARTLKDL